MYANPIKLSPVGLVGKETDRGVPVGWSGRASAKANSVKPPARCGLTRSTRLHMSTFVWGWGWVNSTSDVESEVELTQPEIRSRRIRENEAAEGLVARSWRALRGSLGQANSFRYRLVDAISNLRLYCTELVTRQYVFRGDHGRGAREGVRF